MKGMGEGGLIGGPSAIVNAISDALGVPVDRTPLRPCDVLELVDAAAALDLAGHPSHRGCPSTLRRRFGVAWMPSPACIARGCSAPQSGRRSSSAIAAPSAWAAPTITEFPITAGNGPAGDDARTRRQRVVRRYGSEQDRAGDAGRRHDPVLERNRLERGSGRHHGGPGRQHLFHGEQPGPHRAHQPHDLRRSPSRPPWAAGAIRAASRPGRTAALWFTEGTDDEIGRITTGLVVTDEFRSVSGNNLREITAGPDGNLWFTESGSPGRSAASPRPGVDTEFPTTAGLPTGIATGPDGNIWFAASANPGRDRQDHDVRRRSRCSRAA